MTFLITILIVVIFCNCSKSINPLYHFFFSQWLPVGDGQLETTEKHEAEQFKRVFEHVRSSGESTLASAGDVESRLSSRLSELMHADYNPGFAFVVLQKTKNDLGFLTFDLRADLTPLFNWNAKQLSLYMYDVGE